MTPEVQVALRSELGLSEGKRLFVYDDATGKPIVAGTTVKGNPTIGCGRNLATHGITDGEADILLIDDMEQCEEQLAAVLPWVSTLSAGRQVAIYSLYFNVSLGAPQRFARHWPHFLEQMRTAQWNAAADNLRTSQPWAGEVGPDRVYRMCAFVRSG